MSENSIDHIKFRRIRPRVRFESELNSEQFLEVIKERLSITSDKFEGQILPGYATFYPLQKDQHFWSPQLTLSIEETESGSLIRGLYGPKPSVWTMFMFFYDKFVILVIRARKLDFLVGSSSHSTFPFFISGSIYRSKVRS